MGSFVSLCSIAASLDVKIQQDKMMGRNDNNAFEEAQVQQADTKRQEIQMATNMAKNIRLFHFKHQQTLT